LAGSFDEDGAYSISPMTEGAFQAKRPGEIEADPLAQYRQMLLEITRALAVLALVLFGFSQGTTAGEFPVGASPAVAASIAQSVVSDLCGGGWGDQQGMHAPCHACRSDLSPLPSPAVCEPVAFATEIVVYAASDGVVESHPFYGRPASRAPPLV
jgi:hypothetical protein